MDSYCIAVTLHASCYRYIRVAQELTLMQVVQAICASFGQPYEPYHVLYFDELGNVTTRYDGYLSGENEDEDAHMRYTCDYTLCDIVQVGTRFWLMLGKNGVRRLCCKILSVERGLPGERMAGVVFTGEDRLLGDECIDHLYGAQPIVLPEHGPLFPLRPLGGGRYVQIVREKGKWPSV